jgi:hypothetical protein
VAIKNLRKSSFFILAPVRTLTTIVQGWLWMPDFAHGIGMVALKDLELDDFTFSGETIPCDGGTIRMSQ